ncbi:Fur-regulated basic protein FbpA [Pseudogracilibacillus auburnensis]|uniref:Fur-regulated basic protein A n=1 Tax=Pseudogracilibacillus auburnensis TaxID=1494959 RepID=A0A2V3W638_9BACI|nr:Fur-regulated basic protein FbpA [Pseudogracilibacillus auburnensis]MBO1001597.1 Fur-regulated basic protein FbpA [Pseudogracilibacillus auburnensis]PXW89480.1 Fur-regulated basic protein A [Pseudogracilibacillus auburnensis]
MAHIIQTTDKHRREILINKLIAFKIYKREDQHLYHMSLQELENKYQLFLTESHPHDGLGSLRIKWRKK